MKKRKIFFIVSSIALMICCLSCKPKVLQSSQDGATVSQLLDLQGREKLAAVLETNLGTFELELYAKETPKTVENFVALSVKGYYNGLTFHRVIKDFMIQGGDPTGTGEGGESIYGKKFEDEIVRTFHFDDAGVLAMANAGPNTNGSQFFVTISAAPWLDGRHTIFGKVIGGMNVVHDIGKLRTDKNEKPLKAVSIQKIIIEKRAS
ncbi:MAG: peptidylprolyl isomerase [Ignavibacteriales bacterium]|nr:peptidylprolyl isomerase [Ignavibacteriales bacterium]